MLYCSTSLTYVSHRDKITSPSWITGFKQSFFTNAYHSEVVMRFSPLLWILFIFGVSAFQGTALHPATIPYLLREISLCGSLSWLSFTSFSKSLNFSRNTSSPYFVTSIVKHSGEGSGVPHKSLMRCFLDQWHSLQFLFHLLLRSAYRVTCSGLLHCLFLVNHRWSVNAWSPIFPLLLITPR